MTDRRLVAWEADAAAPGGGRLFAIPPNQATGIPLSAFRTGPALPLAGTVLGEAFLNTTSGTAFVWDGSRWSPIVPSVIVSYPTDAALISDTTQPPGSYGAASDTGNLYIMSASGWRQVGIRTYPNTAALMADNSAADGSTATVLDTQGFFLRTGGKWRNLVPNHVTHMADLNALTGIEPLQRYYVDAVQMMFHRTVTGWEAESVWSASEASILADTAMPNGTAAVASDTGHIYVRVAGAWVGSPVMHYATEAALLAATPPNGVIAIAEDTGLVFSRNAAGWRRVNAAASTVAAAAPVNPAIGEIWSTTSGNSKFWNGTQWVSLSGEAIGTIKMYPSVTPPPDFLLCDGSTIDAKYTELIKVCGPKLPDLRGQFVRGAANQGQIWGGNAFRKFPWTTGRPKNPFVTSTDGRHKHTFDNDVSAGDAGSGKITAGGEGAGGQDINTTWINEAGEHHHTITGGGDAETAPDHVFMAYIIRAE